MFWIGVLAIWRDSNSPVSSLLLHPIKMLFSADPFSSLNEKLATIMGLGGSFVVELSLSLVNVDMR